MARPALREQRVVGGGDVLRERRRPAPTAAPSGTGIGGPLVHDEPLGLPAAGQHGHHPIADREAGGARARAATTSPAASRPGMSAGAPGGGG